MVIKLAALAVFTVVGNLFQQPSLAKFDGHPPVHVRRHLTSASQAPLTPAQTRTAYNLPSSGAAGKTIAIVDAYDSTTIERDLGVFSSQYSLPACTTANGCFKKVKTASRVRTDSGWALEEALDVEWAHAIAPDAKIMLVEARSSSGTDLLTAVDYARAQPGVTAVSMSWGGSEFAGESSYDSHFASGNGGPMAFFASSGDNGTGVSWPAVSPGVIAVGGTTLTMSGNTVTSETAWGGSGGGVSKYVSEPAFQDALVHNTGSKRGVPDVSYNADPATGFPVYDSTPYGFFGSTGWYQIGGTSAGAPQWAAIHALGAGVTSASLYSAANSPSYSADFRDILTGTNGSCGTICTAATGYDYITGLGSPRTIGF